MKNKTKTPKKKGRLQGRWTSSQHDRFLKGFDIYGRDWVSVQRLVKTRTLVQVRSHAQKVLQKMSDDEYFQQTPLSDSKIISYCDGSSSQMASELNSGQINKKKVVQVSPPKQNLLEYFSKALQEDQEKREQMRNTDIQSKENQSQLMSEKRIQIKLPPLHQLEKYVINFPTPFMEGILQRYSYFEKGGNFLQQIFHQCGKYYL